MTIRSLTALSALLDEELTWRKRELTTLKFLIEQARRHERTLLLRAAQCVLYAHWEGFIKAASIGYVSFVASRGLRYSDLSPNFVALGLRGEIVQAGQSDKPTAHTTLTRRLISDLSESADIDWEHSVNTRSNLNTDILNEIYCLLGLDSRSYLLKKQLLDQKLVGVRNLVAHGVKVDIELDDYVALYDEVMQLLQMFRTDVENAAITEAFRRQIIES